jgi:hypothetical protein
VIVSIDTLKSARYRATGRHGWDVVVVDGVHNLELGGLNNELARRLARTWKALILASAAAQQEDRVVRRADRLLDTAIVDHPTTPCRHRSPVHPPPALTDVA